MDTINHQPTIDTLNNLTYPDPKSENPSPPATEAPVMCYTHQLAHLFRPYAINATRAPKRRASKLETEPSAMQPPHSYAPQPPAKYAAIPQIFYGAAAQQPTRMPVQSGGATGSPISTQPPQTFYSMPSPTYIPPTYMPAATTPPSHIMPTPPYMMPTPPYMMPTPPYMMPTPRMPPPCMSPQWMLPMTPTMPQSVPRQPSMVMPLPWMPPTTASMPQSTPIQPSVLMPPAVATTLPRVMPPLYMPPSEAVPPPNQVGFIMLAPELNFPLFSQLLQKQHIAVRLGRLTQANTDAQRWRA